MPHEIQETSSAVTDGIRVAVRSRYVPEQSQPLFERFVFAYTVRVHNEGRLAAQLLSRHWIVADCNGKVEQVRGPGVVGAQPILRPGEHFEYTSHAVLEAPRGELHGSYRMRAVDGRTFDAVIAPFLLAQPHWLN
jgi:ApaG protein